MRYRFALPERSAAGCRLRRLAAAKSERQSLRLTTSLVGEDGIILVGRRLQKEAPL